MKQTMRYLTALLLSGFWVMWVNRGVLSHLFITPSTFTMASVYGIAAHVGWPLLLLLLCGFICFGIGERCLRIMGCSANDGESRLVATALGFGTLGTLLWVLGLAGAYQSAVFTMVAGAGLLNSIGPLRRLHKSGTLRIQIPIVRSWSAVPLIALIFYALWHVTISALAPPTTWDVLAYHLAIPKLYLKTGSIQTIPWLLHSHWPHLTEVFYGIPLAWKVPELASLLHASGALMILVWLWIVACRFFNRRTALLAVAMMASQYVFLTFAGTAHCDAIYALFFLLSISALWKAAEQQSRSWLLVAGLLTGISASVKLTGFIFLVLMSLGILLHQQTPRPRLKWSLLFFASGFAILIPWLAHTALTSGDPVWPFLSKWLSDKHGGGTLRSFYLYNCTWHNGAFLNYMNLYGAQYFLIPFILFGWVTLRKCRKPPGFLLILLFPAPFYILFLLHHTELWRFAWPLIPGFVLTTACSVSHSISRGMLQRIVASIVFLASTIPVIALSQNNALFSILELRSTTHPSATPRDLYLDRTLDHYDFYKRLSASIPPDSKILLFQEIRGYYLDCDYQWGDPINQGLLRYQEMPDDTALLKQLRRFHITHVLRSQRNAHYHQNEMYYSARILSLMDGVLSRYADPVETQNGLSLYRLRDSSNTHVPL